MESRVFVRNLKTVLLVVTLALAVAQGTLGHPRAGRLAGHYERLLKATASRATG